MTDIGKTDPVGVRENDAAGITEIKTVDTAETDMAGVGKIGVASTVKIDIVKVSSINSLSQNVTKSLTTKSLAVAWMPRM